jgi:chemotaxis protein methyltransferase CheR
MRDYTASYIAAGGSAAFSDYYRVVGDRALFDRALGERMVFACHNLASDGPFNEFDLVVCRNVLIYFGRDLQARSLSLFDDSLRPLGVLALGSTESLAGTALRERYVSLEDGAALYRKRGR